MSTNKGAYVVAAILLAVLSFCVAWGQWGTGPRQQGTAQNMNLVPAKSGALDLMPATASAQAESTDVNIVIDPKTGASGKSQTAQDTGEQKQEENPVAAFFSNLAAKIKGDGSDAQAQQVSIQVGNENENTDEDVTHEVRIDVEKYPIENSGNAGVLIYHTHTTEAYTPVFPGEYVPVGDMRTGDKNYSVCAVGQKIADLLSQQYGFTVIHDTTNNETTPFTASYDKSLQTEKAQIAKNPNLGIFIDVHRDSISDTAFAAKDVVTKDGKQYARVMFVVGRGDGYAGEEAPDWQANYAVAKAVSDEINRLMPGLSRGIMVKAKRYNQQLSNKSMLIEFGYNANTLEEAENSADIVAQALGTILGK